MLLTKNGLLVIKSGLLVRATAECIALCCLEDIVCDELFKCSMLDGRTFEAYGPETIALDTDGTDLTQDCFSGVPDADRIAGGTGTNYAVLLWCCEGCGQPPVAGADQINWTFLELTGDEECENTSADCFDWDTLNPIDTGIFGTFGIREV